MVARGDPTPLSRPGARSICRCGHRPTHHMVVEPVGETGNFRLVPKGPCVLCGESVCRQFVPGPS